MKSSFRAKRMVRNHTRNQQQPKLNLVSLMDIFTILVFFLMVNSGDVEVLSNDKTIQLPDSIAEKKPVLSLIVKVSGDALLVQDKHLAPVNYGDDSSYQRAADALASELQYQQGRNSELTDKEKREGRAIIIMGDEAMPYALLKKIMTTCAANDYRDISLAVNQLASAGPSTSQEI